MANFKVKFSIQWKLIIQILFLIILVTGTLSYYLLGHAKQKQLESLISKSKLILENLNTVCSEGIVQEDILVINDAVKRYTVDPEIGYIVLYDQKGKLMIYNDGKNIYDDMGAIQDKEVKHFIKNKTVLKKLDLASVYFKKYNKPGELPPPVRASRRNKNGDLILEYYLPIKYKTPFIKTQLGTIRIGFDTKIVFASINLTRNKILIFIVGVLLIAIIGTILSAKNITNPIKRLSNHFRTVGEGNLEQKINMKRSDEIGLLAYEFDDMTVKLDKAQKELIEKTLLERDIQTASKIQTSLLPDNYIVKENIEMAGYSQSAKGVGGDYFDFITIDKDRDGVVICDVSGKGIPAALLMAMLKTIFHVSAGAAMKNSSTMCDIANKFISNNTPAGRFATAQYAIINRKTGKMNFTNAGHGELHIFRKSKNEFENISLKDCIPLGLRVESEYNEITLKLEKGDIINFFTDGVTEARNHEAKEYGKGNIERIVKEENEKNAKEINNKILADITSFVGDTPPHDDLTLLTVKYI
ncbi:SpoIIE family protein phosphatase [Spirochaetota bacterium]